MHVLSDPRKRRWLGWLSLVTVFLLVNVYRLSTAVLSEDLTAVLKISAAQLGTLHASFFFIYAFVQIPTGILADRYGARVVATTGAMVLSLGAVAFTMSSSYLTAFAARAVIGLGSGVIFISTIRFCANWYRRDEFGTMTGLTTGMAGLGAIIATTPLAIAIDRFGWRPTILFLSACGFVAAGGVWVLVRRSPADAGLESIEDVPDQPTVTLADATGALRSLVVDVEQWLLSIAFFASMGTMLTVIGLWGVPYLVSVHGLDVTTASTYTLLGSIGILIGGPGIGWVSDRISQRFRPMVVGLGFVTIVLSVIPLVGSPPLVVVAFVYVVIGGSIGFTMLSLPIMKEKYPAAASGVATATVNGAGFLGGAVLPPVMGLALDRYRTGDVVAGSVVYTEFGYRVAFGVTTVGLGIAFLCAVVLTYRRRVSVGY
ncbi:MAG: MFS transporter [Natronomonas sp.]